MTTAESVFNPWSKIPKVIGSVQFAIIGNGCIVEEVRALVHNCILTYANGHLDRAVFDALGPFEPGPKLMSEIKGVEAGIIVTGGSRTALLTITKELSFKLPYNFWRPLIHSSARVSSWSHVKIGPGAVICAGAVLELGVEIGAHSYIGPNAVILHGSKLGKCCHVGAGKVISGEFCDGLAL